MTIWRPQKHDMKRRAYLSLASAILRAIPAGELTAGDRLPMHRDFTFQVGIIFVAGKSTFSAVEDISIDDAL